MSDDPDLTWMWMLALRRWSLEALAWHFQHWRPERQPVVQA